MKLFERSFALVIVACAVMAAVPGCTWTAGEKAAVIQTIKSALAQTGVAIYEAGGRARLETWLTEQVGDGKLTEEQKQTALAAADKGVNELAAFLESASASDTAQEKSEAAKSE